MNKCAEPDCDRVPPNPAVPACSDHLCEKCRMGVIAGSDPSDPLNWGQCAACLDRLAIDQSIRSLYDLLDKRLGQTSTPA